MRTTCVDGAARAITQSTHTNRLHQLYAMQCMDAAGLWDLTHYVDKTPRRTWSVLVMSILSALSMSVYTSVHSRYAHSRGGSHITVGVEWGRSRGTGSNNQVLAAIHDSNAGLLVRVPYDAAASSALLQHVSRGCSSPTLRDAGLGQPQPLPVQVALRLQAHALQGLERLRACTPHNTNWRRCHPMDPGGSPFPSPPDAIVHACTQHCGSDIHRGYASAITCTNCSRDRPS
jgi:hypothetical protein